MTSEGRKSAFENLDSQGIEACICIGGNGTLTGARIFAEEYPIKMIGIPGTIDNDIYGTDYSIEFDTAVNTAVEAVDKIRDTADSHNRIFFIEVMGRHSGYIALNAGIGSGAGEIFIPETDNSIDYIIDKFNREDRRKKLFNLIIVAEGNKSGNAVDLAQQLVRVNPSFDTKVTILGHLQRGGSSSAFDRVLASRLGHGSVMALIDNENAVMAGMLKNEIGCTPFSEALDSDKVPEKSLIDMARILAL